MSQKTSVTTKIDSVVPVWPTVINFCVASLGPFFTKAYSEPFLTKARSFIYMISEKRFIIWGIASLVIRAPANNILKVSTNR